MNHESSGASPFEEARDAVRKTSGWTLFGGILMLIFGITAITMPLVTTLATVLVLGWVFILVGITNMVRSFQDREGTGRIIELAMGLAYVAVGAMVLQNPAAGAISFTLFFAAILLFHSAVEVLLSIRVKPARGWGWALFSGVLGGLLAIMIITRMPVSAAWIIGVWVGVKLIFSGWTLIALGGAGRAITADLANPAGPAGPVCPSLAGPPRLALPSAPSQHPAKEPCHGIHPGYPALILLVFDPEPRPELPLFQHRLTPEPAGSQNPCHRRVPAGGQGRETEGKQGVPQVLGVPDQPVHPLGHDKPCRVVWISGIRIPVGLQVGERKDHERHRGDEHRNPHESQRCGP
jgi:uncharacterized membrane protein HdeD (DUF308 family)